MECYWPDLRRMLTERIVKCFLFVLGGCLFILLLLTQINMNVIMTSSHAFSEVLPDSNSDTLPAKSKDEFVNKDGGCVGKRGGQTEDVEPMRLPEPFYLHYVRFLPKSKERNLRFTDYLSIIAAVHNLKPDGILVHGDYEPEGEYWSLLKSQGVVRHVPRNITINAGQRQGKPKVVAFMEHAADIAKLDILLEYGGVAIDFDVFIIRGERIKEILTRKKAITCYGDADGYNIGFVAAHRDSKLLYAWRRSYQDIYANDWNFNQAFVSKYLSVLFREEVYVVDKVCDNPHPDTSLDDFFRNYGVLQWKDSLAIHSYERFGGVPINSPADLTGNLTTHKELLRSIFENSPLPSADPNFHDEVDPLL